MLASRIQPVRAPQDSQTAADLAELRTEPAPEREDEAREQMLVELERFADEPVSEAELRGAVSYLAGQAEVLVDSPNGQIKVAELEPNSIVGEIAILCDVSRTATVQATGQLEALRIRKDHFLRLLREFPEMTIEIVRVLADRLSNTTAELIEARSNKH